MGTSLLRNEHKPYTQWVQTTYAMGTNRPHKRQQHVYDTFKASF